MLDELTDDVTLNAAEMIARLEYNALIYYYLIYEMRERAVSLVSSICSSEMKARKRLEKCLKNPKQRENALGIVQGQAPRLECAFKHMLDVLDQDIGLRDLHTHETLCRWDC
jgi:hypothetical protein